VRVRVGAGVCERERESKRECVREIACIYVCASEGECGCECGCETERKKERVCARKRESVETVLIMSRFQNFAAEICKRVKRQQSTNQKKPMNVETYVSIFHLNFFYILF